jgi:hypothetical protein
MQARCKGPPSMIHLSSLASSDPLLPMTSSDSFLHHGKIGSADKEDHGGEAAQTKSMTTLPSRAPVHDIAGLFA